MREYKLRTLKQKQLAVRKKQLVAFRRWLALDGDGSAVTDHLDMNVWELREYIESHWQPGMNWENYRMDWVVDHIVALKYFDMFNRKEMKLCWSYNNLKPTWAMDNHAKGYCVEITEKELVSLPQNSTTILLMKHIHNYREMFHPYYKRA